MGPSAYGSALVTSTLSFLRPSPGMGGETLAPLRALHQALLGAEVEERGPGRGRGRRQQEVEERHEEPDLVPEPEPERERQVLQQEAVLLPEGEAAPRERMVE